MIIKSLRGFIFLNVSIAITLSSVTLLLTIENSHKLEHIEMQNDEIISDVERLSTQVKNIGELVDEDLQREFGSCVLNILP